MLDWLKRLFGGLGEGEDGGTSPRDIPPGTYIMGQTRDLLRYKDQLGDDHPQKPLLAFHELAEQEKARWQSDPPDVVMRRDGSAMIRTFDELLERSRPMDMESAEADALAAELCRLYANATPTEREYIRWKIDQQQPRFLGGFAQRSAIAGLRSRDLEKVRNGLIAVAIYDIGPDVRDVMVELGLVHHCARSVMPNPTALFDEVAQMSSPAMFHLLVGFARRTDLGDILSAMGWEEVTDDAGNVDFKWM